MKIRTQADIEKLEQVPVTERIRHASVADLLHESAREHSGSGGHSLPRRHRSRRSGARCHLRRAAAARDPDGEPAARPRYRARRHRHLADAERAGDLLRPVGRRDRGRRQSRELFPRSLADRRHHEAGGRAGVDRGRPVDLPGYLAEGGGHPRGDAGPEGVPRRRRTGALPGVIDYEEACAGPARPTGWWRRRRSIATPWRRCSIPAARRDCRSSPSTRTAR